MMRDRSLGIIKQTNDIIERCKTIYEKNNKKHKQQQPRDVK